MNYSVVRLVLSWAHNNWNKITSDIKLVFHSSTPCNTQLPNTLLKMSRKLCGKKLSSKLWYYRLIRALNVCLFFFRYSWTINKQHIHILKMWARRPVVSWGTALQAGRSQIRFTIMYWHNPSDSWSRLSFEQKLVPGIFSWDKSCRCFVLPIGSKFSSLNYL